MKGERTEKPVDPWRDPDGEHARAFRREVEARLRRLELRPWRENREPERA